MDPLKSHGATTLTLDCLLADNLSHENENTYLVRLFFCSSRYICNPNCQELRISEATRYSCFSSFWVPSLF